MVPWGWGMDHRLRTSVLDPLKVLQGSRFSWFQVTIKGFYKFSSSVCAVITYQILRNSV